MMALFLLGALAFNAPMLSIFSVRGMLFGIPVLYVYLFVAWAALIAFMALTTRRSDTRERAEASSQDSSVHDTEG